MDKVTRKVYDVLRPQLQVWDRVRLEKLTKHLYEKVPYVGYADDMEECIGEVGIVFSRGRNHYYSVSFPNGLWIIHITDLRRVNE